MDSGKARPALIALDFDGTLVDWRDGTPYVSAQTRETLAQAIAGGIHVGLCSGRRWYDMRTMMASIGMAWGQPFPSFVVSLEKQLYWVRDGRLEENGFADFNRARAAEMELLARDCLRCAPGWLEALGAAGLRHRIWHLYGDYGLEVTYETPEEAEQARILLADLVQAVPNAHVHRNSRSAYVVPASCTKGIALRGMAEILGLPPGRILGVGDSLNDLDMVDGRYGLVGATLANADPVVLAAVRAAGGYIASAPAEAGVHEVIRRML